MTWSRLLFKVAHHLHKVETFSTFVTDGHCSSCSQLSIEMNEIASLCRCYFLGVWMGFNRLSLSLSLWKGAESFLSTIRIRPSFLCGKTHRHGDDEVDSGDAVVTVLCVSCEGLYCWQHPSNQQPLPTAGGGDAFSSQCSAHPEKLSLIHLIIYLSNTLFYYICMLTFVCKNCACIWDIMMSFCVLLFHTAYIHK